MNILPVSVELHHFLADEDIAVECEEGWFSAGGGCFKMSDDKLTWDDAVTACSKMDAQLATCLSRDENFFLGVKQMEDQSIYKETFWVGFSDK